MDDASVRLTPIYGSVKMYFVADKYLLQSNFFSFLFPNLARGTENSDFIQPGLIQLQPKSG